MKRFFIADLSLLITCLAIVWLSFEHPALWATNAGLIGPYLPSMESAAAPETKPEAAEPRKNIAPVVTETSKKEVSKTRATKRRLSSKVLIPGGPDTIPYLAFDPMMLKAMYEQANYLRRDDVPGKGASGITKGEMLQTVELLQSVQLLDPNMLLANFDFYGINTELHNDRVRMTGYYTPVVKASKVRTTEYSVPMLRRPESNVPPAEFIEGGALNGRGLELAWLRSKKELANAQLQGNCLVEYPDGTRQHFGFGASVKRSKGKGKYVFFTPVDNQVLGCGYFPLTPGYSVAVDPRFIPIGSTLLAELPNIDANGKLRGYTYRIIFAQDRGGAILTTKRIDLYSGVGQKGLQEARKINRYGRLWLMLPKER
ncbi:MAG TPA: MltA domain-containing protein [Saprospiraceae bacterium]|nr:MltA domain-containing protein [Saprospiraceae bacterium]